MLLVDCQVSVSQWLLLVPVCLSVGWRLLAVDCR